MKIIEEELFLKMKFIIKWIGKVKGDALKKLTLDRASWVIIHQIPVTKIETS